MKKTASAIKTGIACALLALVVFVPLAALGDGTVHNLVAVTTTATGTSVPTQGACVTAVVWSASTSSGAVLFEQSGDGTTWVTRATFTDPTSTATSAGCYAMKWSRLRVSARVSGTFSGDITYVSPVNLVPANVTSINRVTITAPATSATLTILDGKTAKFDKTIEFDGTDSTKMTFPTTSATIARTDAGQTFTGTHVFGNITDSGLTATRIPFAGTAGLLGDASGFTYISGAVAVPTSIATTRFLSTGTAPAVSNTSSNSCGTTAASIVGKDQASTITVGATSGTSCTVTFNVAFANAPVCVASGTVATGLTVATTTTTAIVAGTLTAAEKIHLVCLGY